MEDNYHKKLKIKIHNFVTYCYEMSKKCPKEELYGLISQLRRASMSVMLNYVEGYARKREKVKLNFYEMSHGSSQECKYIIYFIYTQSWITKQEYISGVEMVNEIGKMLWMTIQGIEDKINVS